MSKWLFPFIFLCFPAFADVQVILSDTELVEHQPLRMTFIITNSRASEIKPVNYITYRRDFVETSKYYSDNIRVTRDGLIREKKIVLTLMPQRLGTLQTPSFKVGDEETPSQAILVKPNPKNVAQQQAQQQAAAAGGKPPVIKDNNLKQYGLSADDIFFTAEVENAPAYFKGQVVYTLKLYVAPGVPIRNMTFSIPGITPENFLYTELGMPTSSQTTINGRTYAVAEHRIALFPQKSGELTIPPARMDGFLQVNPYEDSFLPLLSLLGQEILLLSNDVKVNVQPPLSKEKLWLPSPHVAVKDDFPEKVVYRQNEPITWKVTVSGVGMQASLLPDVNLPEIKGAKLYPGDSEDANYVDISQGIVGSRTKTFMLIPYEAGTLTLPEISLPYFNTVAKKMQTASLPARTLDIAPEEEPLQAQPGGEKDEAAKDQGLVGLLLKYMEAGAVVLAGLLGILFLVVFLRQRRKEAASKEKDLTTAKALWKELKKAAAENDPVRTRALALRWAEEIFKKPVPNLEALCVLLPSQEFKEAADDMSRSLYGKTRLEWVGGAFFEALVGALKKAEKKKKAGESPLPNLYPFQ